jgi:hypothetical protein
MPAYPDRDTLRLRRPDRRTPAELAALARRELARRPAATRWDVSLRPPDRALAMFRANYPAAAERFHPAVLWVAAHDHPRPASPRGPERCPGRWCLALAWVKRYGGPALRVDPIGRALLGDPGPKCAAAVGWQPPKPKPKPRRARSNAGSAGSSRGTNRTRAARSSTPARHATSRRPDPAVARFAATVAAALAPRPVAPDTPYNRAAVARLYRATGSPSLTPAGMGWSEDPSTRRGRQ